ncbi:MAG: response regulator [bacterium]
MAVRKIMIVDDNKDLLNELQEILLSSGYETIAIDDCAAVMHIAHNEKPDVILLDLKMDTMSGFQIARRLKGLSATAHIPIIAMTGVFTSEDNYLFMNTCGIKMCIEKPFNPRDVLARIEEVTGTSL